jgi:hypothetical protein
MFYQIGLSMLASLWHVRAHSLTVAACPTFQAIVRLQILSVLAHLASRPTEGASSTTQFPSFISFGAIVDDSNQQRVGGFLLNCAKPHSKQAPPLIYVHSPGKEHEKGASHNDSLRNVYA